MALNVNGKVFSTALTCSNSGREWSSAEDRLAQLSFAANAFEMCMRNNTFAGIGRQAFVIGVSDQTC